MSKRKPKRNLREMQLTTHTTVNYGEQCGEKCGESVEKMRVLLNLQK